MIFNPKLLVQPGGTEVAIHQADRIANLRRQNIGSARTHPSVPTSGLRAGEHNVARAFRTARKEQAVD
jgi:hypothetical protein